MAGLASLSFRKGSPMRNLKDVLEEMKNCRDRARASEDAAMFLRERARLLEEKAIKAMQARNVAAVRLDDDVYRIDEDEAATSSRFFLRHETAPVVASELVISDLVDSKTPRSCMHERPGSLEVHHRMGPDGRCLDCRAMLEMDISDAEAASLVEELRRPPLAEAVTEDCLPAMHP